MIISGNKSLSRNSSDGGGFYETGYKSSMLFVNDIISENSCDRTGSALALLGTGAFGMTNCTIANNKAFSSNTTCSVFVSDGHSTTFTNTIYTSNEAPLFAVWLDSTDTMRVNHSLFQFGKNTLNFPINKGSFFWTSGNKSGDPQFVDYEQGDFRLKASSSCIDAGTTDSLTIVLPAVDVWGNERIMDGNLDSFAQIEMGALEYDPAGSSAVDSEDGQIVEDFVLLQNYPNPFNPSTQITYKAQQEGHVQMSVYDVKDERVKSLVDDHKLGGTYLATWDGRTEIGVPASSGTYFCRINIDSRSSSTIKMLLLK